MTYLKIELESYEDLFESLQSGHNIKIRDLSIKSRHFDKYSVNKLFFDISQNHLQVNSLKIKGGLSDSHLTKITHLHSSSCIRVLDLSQNSITDEGALMIG